MVLEIAEGIHPSGQTVDLHGTVTAVVERIGLMDRLCERNLDQRDITQLPVTSYQLPVNRR
ncbi:hypothetical protein [Mycobacterium lepromatosis]|uniref:hypothetical protein n=1 Tax=Mycobacterium lepromatosis TaxID=480418 RepID=UPI0005F80C78|nr:hypothetical protein [Mycobacterium lepromatosis]